MQNENSTMGNPIIRRTRIEPNMEVNLQDLEPGISKPEINHIGFMNKELWKMVHKITS